MLTTTEAAEVANVTPSTIKRWADDGVLPVRRTPGGHRRFSRHDVEACLRGDGADAPAAGPADAWIGTLVAGHRHEIDERLLEARALHGTWAAVADLLGRVLAAVGEAWQEGHLAIGTEHRASEGLARSLARIGDALPAATFARPVLLACAEDDDHALGLALAELCVREVGLPVIWLGRRTPVAGGVRAIREHQPSLVGLSASAASQDRAALRAASDTIGAACASHNATLVLGGTGAWPDDASRVRRPGSFTEFRDVLLREVEGAIP